MAHSGKTMTFATDLVPQEDDVYSLGRDNLKWIIHGSLPLSDITDADDLKAIEALSGASGLLKKTAANTWTLDTSNYVTSSGITSVTIGATSPVQSSTSTAQNGSSASTTISLKDAYGDTKNPYGAKAKNLVLAGPSSGSNAAPSFRALVAADIPTLAYVPATSGVNDVNTLVNTGVYNITSGSATNAPKGYGYGQLLVMSYRKHTGNTTTDWASQIYLHNGVGTETGNATGPGNVLYYRTSNTSSSNSWFSWQKAVHVDDTYTKVGDTNKPVYIAADGTATPISYTIAKSVPSDAVFTDHYAWGDITGKPTKITLTGAVTGNVSLGEGELTLSTSVNHNHNSSYLTAVGYDTTNKKIYYTKNGSNTDVVTAATLRTDMGLSNALHFIGITSTTLTDGATTSTLAAKSTNSLSKTTGFVDGDVVMDGDQLREYVWSGSAWRLLGITTSTTYTQPASTATNTWIAQISQGTDGKITATTGSLNTSGTWSGNATTATSATTATYIKCTDTRNATLNPTDLTAAQGVRFDFKAKGTINLTATDAYAGVMSFRPYASNTDWSGGNAHQLAFNSEGLHWRNGGASWGNWYQILDSNNTTTGTNNTATLTWNTTYTIAKINGTDIKFTTMTKPTYAFSDLTSHPTTLSDYGITNAVQYNGIDNDIGSSATAANAKSYWANNNKVPKGKVVFNYNSSGTEFTTLFSNNNNSYGSILRWGYQDTYIRILRAHPNQTTYNGWYTEDWEKISAGYADSAGSATSAGKWTTARNISISDSDGTNTGTAVSVDGSAAVTLKLPATIKADITGDAATVNGLTVQTAVPANAVFTDTNKYHKTGSWSGLTYTATAVNNADELKFTIPNKIQTNWELNATSGNSPALLFTRDSTLTDWKMFVTSGKLSFQSATDGSTWTERAYFKDNSGDFVATSFTGNGSALTSLNASNISSGTLNLARLGNQNANTVLAGPGSGSAAAPSFRTLVTADIPDLGSIYVKKNSELLTTNPFAPQSLKGPYISKIDNAFYAADKRWTVTTNGLNAAVLFDGSYESQTVITAGNSATILMDFDPNHNNSAYFPGYPYGYILISFYYTSGPASITGRVYCNYSSQGIGWHDISFSPVSDNGSANIVYKSAHQGYYNISQLEITITAPSSNNTGITQIEMHLDRPSSALTPFLSKYNAETLYYNLTAPKFIGALQGNADTATKFNSTRKIELTGAVTGSATTDGSSGWTISTTVNHNHDTRYNIASGVITLGSNTITPVTSVNGHSGSSVSVTASDLGLASALKYVGTKSSLPTATDSTTYSTYNNGDVITVSAKEYAYVKGSNAAGSSWVELGDEGSYKLRQTAFANSTGTADGTNTSTAFIYSFSQDENGAISNIKTRQLPTLTNVSYTATAATDDNEYPVLMKNSTGSDTTAAGVRFASGTNQQVTINPSTGTVSTRRLVINNSSSNGTVPDLVFSRTSWSYINIPDNDAAVLAIGRGTGDNASQKLIIQGDGVVRPGSDNTQVLGKSTRRWKQVYGVNFYGTFNGTATSAQQLAAREIDNSDLNQFSSGGALKYAWAGGNNGINSKPTNVNAFGVIAMKTAASWTGQLLMSTDSEPGLYWRTNLTTETPTYGTWARVWDSSNHRVFYGTCAEAAGTAAKPVVCTDYDEMKVGDIITVKFNNTNTAASPTLNVNGKGSKSVKMAYSGGTADLSSYTQLAGIRTFIYDGTNWILQEGECVKQGVTDTTSDIWRPVMLGAYNSTDVRQAPEQRYAMIHAARNVKYHQATGTLRAPILKTPKLSIEYSFEDKAHIQWNDTDSSIDFIFD